MTVTRDLPLAELQQLFALFNARRYTEMEQLARALLRLYPGAGMGWKSLAVALQVQGKDALAALQRAAALLPADAELPSNLGNILSDAGRFEEAIVSYRRALAIQPAFAEAHGNMGLALTRAGQLEAAVASLRRALQLKPEFTEAHNNLGNALMKLGRIDEAILSYQRSVGLNPGHARAHMSLGAAWQTLGRLENAVASYRRAEVLQPDLPELHFNLGTALLELGRQAEAVQSLERAVLAQPDQAAAHSNLGLALLGLKRGDAAIEQYRRALACEPASTGVLNNLANALKTCGQPDEAIGLYERAIALRPEERTAHANLGALWREQGRFEKAADCYRRILALAPGDLAARSDLLFLHNYLDAELAPGALAQAREFGAWAARSAQPYTAWSGRPQAERCLRVGLVSGDLREHPVGYFTQTVLAALARQAPGRVELYVYAPADAADPLARGVQAACRQWSAISALDDEAAARRIHQDGIDLLIDLSGHTAHNRLPLFAWKAAPVQLSWLGYCASTGLAEMDYILTDPWIAPPGAEAEFIEPLWRLPESFLCFTPPALDIAVGPLPALSQGHITFGCFNNLSKVGDEVLILWARLLQAMPGSRLFLKAPQLDSPVARQSITDRLAHAGVAADRLRLAGASPRADYLAAYNEVDIALDPFPYPGGTTSIEGLWMGVPLLSMTGQQALARQGESILRNAGLPDWIAADADDYLARAVRHAADLPALAALRQRLRGQLLASPLGDAPRFAAHLEQALREMWRRWCARQAQSPGMPTRL